MSALILLRGNSGSGKSTTAKLLQRHFGRGTLLISQDAVRRDMLYARDGKDSPAIPLLINLARYGSRHCETVIVEGILDAEVYAGFFEVLREEFPSVFAYYYDLPFEETLRRHETKPNRMDFGREDMARWWKERDLLHWPEEKVIGPELSQEATVQMICSAVESH